MTKDEIIRCAIDALEAIAWSNNTTWQSQRAKIEVDAIKEALAKPEQEPVALPEKIYEFVPTPEPVKWHHPECEGACIACLIEQVVQEAYGSQGLGYLQRHLTPPPHRKPLTDEEIWNLAANCLDSVAGRLQFARAIEAAHGIKA